MSTFFSPAKMWLAALLLLVFDVLLVQAYVAGPAVLSADSDASAWDFRIDEARPAIDGQAARSDTANPVRQPDVGRLAP